MTLYDALFQRHSIRKYRPESLSAMQLAMVADITDAAPRLHPDIPLQIQLVADGALIHQIISGVIGSYGKIRAPHYLVATARPDDGYLENVGYTLEHVILELTTRGLATCWIGGHVNPALLQQIVTIPDGEKPVVLVSFGLPAEGTPLQRSNLARIQRKSPADLLIAGEPDPVWRQILEAVRVAPSAVNSQPWRFAVTDHGVDLYLAHGNALVHHFLGQMNHIDIGIALRHLTLAAETLGGPVALCTRPAKERAGMTYIISALAR